MGDADSSHTNLQGQPPPSAGAVSAVNQAFLMGIKVVNSSKKEMGISNISHIETMTHSRAYSRDGVRSKGGRTSLLHLLSKQGVPTVTWVNMPRGKQSVGSQGGGLGSMVESTLDGEGIEQESMALPSTKHASPMKIQFRESA